MNTTSHKPRWLVILSILLAFTLVAAACGDDDDSSSSSSDDSSSEESSSSDDSSAEDSSSDDSSDDDSSDDDSSADDSSDDDSSADEGAAAASDDSIQLGILGACTGEFGPWEEDVSAGAQLAMIDKAGATSNSPTTSLEGFSGAEIAGLPIELVGIGCGDATPDTIIQEVRRLVEQDGANVVIGPLSGDEGIAVANYALDHPEVTFLNGIAGAQEATLHVQAPNFFRFHGDGAQWGAGLGELMMTNGWETAAVIADDYGFGWSSAAGFVAEFCAVGGEVVAQVFPPLETTDYSSWVAQLPDPDEVDGYYWAIGADTPGSLQAFVDSKGDLNGPQFAGNLFFSPGLADALGTGIAGAYVGGFAALPGDISTPEIDEYLASADAAWESLKTNLTGGEAAPPSVAASFGFFYGYYSAGLALLTALEAVDGDLSNDHEALRAELSAMTLAAPYGDLKLDENRQAIVDTYVQQLTLNDDGTVGAETLRIIPEVDQTFNGIWEDAPPHERDNTPCVEHELPWVGNTIEVVDGVPQG